MVSLSLCECADPSPISSQPRAQGGLRSWPQLHCVWLLSHYVWQATPTLCSPAVSGALPPTLLPRAKTFQKVCFGDLQTPPLRRQRCQHSTFTTAFALVLLKKQSFYTFCTACKSCYWESLKLKLNHSALKTLQKPFSYSWACFKCIISCWIFCKYSHFQLHFALFILMSILIFINIDRNSKFPYILYIYIYINIYYIYFT